MPRSSFSFPRARRLARASEFDRVRRDGRVWRGKALVLSVLRKSGTDRFRAGFITSRRIGTAVTRNRVRRRLREIVRHHQHEILPGASIVTVARAAAADATYRELEDEWLRLAKRASILGR
jgi:ribonuclease P protein component